MCFARGAEGRVAGRPFFGSFLWSEQRNEQTKNPLNLFSHPFFAVKERVRKKAFFTVRTAHPAFFLTPGYENNPVANGKKHAMNKP
jgi:hypothetical protein